MQPRAPSIDFPSPRRTCFWTGAGISADLPTALPLGDALTKTIVERVCGREVWADVCEDFWVAEMTSPSGRLKAAPRLEWVTEHLCRVVGDEALQGFRAFVDAQPNDLHRFFAAHLAEGGCHVTMNFDRCIEKASGGSAAPIHLHGALSPSGLGDLRTRTLELTEGLHRRDAAAVTAGLESTDLLIFLGYSGRDYFDVDPFFRALAAERPGSLAGLKALWVEHDAGLEAALSVDRQPDAVVDGRPILQALERLGASVSYVRAPTRRLLAEAASGWGITAPAPAPASGGDRARAESLRRAATEISVSAPDRLAASAVFWFSMGAGRRVVELDQRLERSTDPAERGVRDRLAHVRMAGLMGVGFYRRAARLAREMEDPAWRHETLAAAYRLRGSAARSLYHLLRALALCDRPCGSDPRFAAHCGDAREGYVAWYRTARGSSIGRPIALARRGAVALARLLGRDPWFDPVRVFEQFRDCEAYVVGHPHAIEQIARAWREVPEFQRTGPLPATIVSRQAEIGAVFVETDHFLGHLNSERNRLARAVIDSRQPGSDIFGPSPLELQRHRRQAEHQADLPGELKAVLLERLAGCSGNPFPLRSLLEVEWATRAKVIWLLRWARHSWPRR